jgi:diguanylate cyclase (GGDEF)-like protein
MDENTLPANNPQLLSNDFQALLSAYSAPTGLCDGKGEWLMLSDGLSAQLSPPQQVRLSAMLAQPSQWANAWRRMQRNRFYELPDLLLADPLRQAMIHSRRLYLPSMSEPIFLIEFQPRLKYLQPFIGLSRQYRDQIRYQHHALLIARQMQTAVTQSLTDPLTGIANRRAFDDGLQRAWSDALQRRQPLSVLLLDIDFFKDINDHWGHLHGDEVLKQLAKCLSNSLARPNDLMARIGGEEFGVILPNTDSLGAHTVAEFLLGEVRRLHLPHPSQKIRPYVTLSIGACSTATLSNDTANSLLHHADLALYKAKATGRDRCCIGSIPVILDEPLMPINVLTLAAYDSAKPNSSQPHGIR